MMLKKRVLTLIASGITLIVSGTENSSEIKEESTSPGSPFDYGAPALNRHSAMAIRNVSRQLKLRGIVGLANGARTAMIDLGDDGRNLIVAKGGKIRVPLKDVAKDASAKINWIELRITDIGEAEMTLQCVDDRRQQFVLR